MAFPTERELILTRLIPVSRETLFRCWTEPELLKQWFTPPPFTVPHAELDVRAGGFCNVTMQGPDGQQYPNPGVYLEVVPGRKLVFTDAFTAAWEPSEKAFMVGIITFDDEDGQTRYTAKVRHWSTADAEQHLAMGFHQGWGIATDQLTALAAKL